MPAYDDDMFDLEWDKIFGGGDVVSPEGDPYEQDYLGGDSDGSGSWDWEEYLKDGPGYLSKFGGIGDVLSKMFGGPSKGAGMGLGDILPLLALLGGGINQHNATKDASKEIQAGADKANQFALDTIGGARGDFKPYMEGGTKALGMVFDELGKPGVASKYTTPINRVGPSNLKGTVSLKQLMGK